MKRTAALIFALLFGLTASVAHAGKGIYEAPMLDLNTSAEVGEGKIERDGTYKVEVSQAAVGTYKLCVHYNNTSSSWLGTVDLLEAGELKFPVADLGTGAMIAPYFMIYMGGTAQQCDGTPVYESGLSVL